MLLPYLKDIHRDAALNKSAKAPISENAKFPFTHAGRSNKKEMPKI
jgi:hypothetical protein